MLLECRGQLVQGLLGAMPMYFIVTDGTATPHSIIWATILPVLETIITVLRFDFF